MSLVCAVACTELLFFYPAKALLRYALSEALVCSCLSVLASTAKIANNEGWAKPGSQPGRGPGVQPEHITYTLVNAAWPSVNGPIPSVEAK